MMTPLVLIAVGIAPLLSDTVMVWRPAVLSSKEIKTSLHEFSQPATAVG
jgi:hypothetical protein